VSAEACKHRIPKEAENGKSAVFCTNTPQDGHNFSR
jgi:hypothetical protein